MARTDIHHHNATAEGAVGAVGLTILLFGAILVAPGALIVFWVDRMADLALDRGPLWTFAGVASAAIVAVLSAAARSLGAGVLRYFLMALGIAAFILIARFGFHADWPRELWRAFTGLGS